MALNVGDLQATLNLNSKGFTTGINQAKNELNSFISTLDKGLKTSAEGADKSLNDATSSMKGYNDKVVVLDDNITKTTKDVDGMSNATGKLSDKTGVAKDMFGKFKSLLGLFGVGVGLTAVMKWVEDFIKKIEKAKDDVQQLQATIDYSTGASSDVLERLKDVTKQIAFDIPVKDYQDIGKALGAVGTYWDGKATTEQIQALTEDFLALKLIYQGINIESLISKSNDLFVKWKIPVEEQIDLLAQLRQIQQNTGIELNSLISGMNELDDMQGYLEMSLNDVLSIVGGMQSQADYDDFIAGIGKLKSTYQDMYDKATDELKDSGLTESDAQEQASTYMKAFFKEVLDEAGSNYNLDKASAIIVDKLGLTGKFAISIGEMAQAMYNSDNVQLQNVKSNIDASKTNDGKWTDTQLGWKDENIKTTMNAMSDIAKASSIIAEQTSKVVSEGYIYNPEYRAKYELTAQNIDKMNDAVSEYSGFLGNLMYLATLPTNIKNEMRGLISEIGREDTSKWNLNVEVNGIPKDQYDLNVDAHQSSVQLINDQSTY